jgi:hypothetical protein
MTNIRRTNDECQTQFSFVIRHSSFVINTATACTLAATQPSHLILPEIFPGLIHFPQRAMPMTPHNGRSYPRLVVQGCNHDAWMDHHLGRGNMHG